MIFSFQTTHDTSYCIDQRASKACKYIIPALLQLICLWGTCTSISLAAAPEIINYQGQISVGSSAVTNSAGQFKFALVDNTGTTTYWSNDGTSVNGSEPISAVSIPVNAGLFSVGLGDTSITNMTSGISPSIVSVAAPGAPVFVKIWFDDGVGGFQALSPSLPLVSVPYALNATSVPPGSITQAELADGAITAEKIEVGSKQTGSISMTDPGWPSVTFSPGFKSTPLLDLSYKTLDTISPTGFTLDAEYIRKIANSNYSTSLSFAMVNGKPAISYYDGANRGLKYVIANDVDGSSWGTPITVDSTYSVGYDSSLTVVNGKPAISYYDDANRDLRYVIANDADGSSWNTPITVESVGDVGQHTSLAVVNGKPAISFYNLSDGEVHFVIANDADGSNWGIRVTVDVVSTTVDSSIMNTSLAVVNGKPAISYVDLNSSDIKYVIATHIDGSTWGIPVTIANTVFLGSNTSLSVVNGKPAVSYWDWGWGISNSGLKYVIANDASGNSWGTPVTLDNTVSRGIHNSLEVVNGKPAIAYSDHLGNAVKYIIATDADGIGWSTPVIVASIRGRPLEIFLSIINGKPAISFNEEVVGLSNGGLKYVIASDIVGSNWDTVYWTAEETLDTAVGTAATATTATFLGSLSEHDVVQAGAIESINSDMIANNSITSADIADGSITSADYAIGSVDSTAIAFNSITANELAEDYVMVSGDTMSGSLTISTPDTAISDLNLHGTVQGTGRLFVGQSSNYGGGLLYNGDDRPDIIGGTDRITFFRRSAGIDREVISYAYNSNNIRIQGRLDNHCTADANRSPDSGCFRIGDPAGLFLLMDANEINARNGTRSSTLYLQHEGGAVAVNGAIVHASDINMKQDFGFVDSQEVLNRLASLDISEWTYKHDSLKGTRHIGPSSQAFKAAFGLGDGDKHIATMDADGIALTAIKALREEKDAQIEEIKSLLTVKNAVMAEQAQTLLGLNRELAQIKEALARLIERLNQGNLAR